MQTENLTDKNANRELDKYLQKGISASTIERMRQVMTTTSIAAIRSTVYGTKGIDVWKSEFLNHSMLAAIYNRLNLILDHKTPQCWQDMIGVGTVKISV